ncbi:MAG: hypothetical protein U0401_31990 [Anaerolineae bacterium]
MLRLWIDTLYFTVPQTATVGITLENPNGKFEFVKDGEKWTLKGLAAGETFNENNFFPFMNQAIGLRMTEPLGKEDSWFGSNKPQATVTVLTKEGDQTKSYTLEIGAKNDKDNSYVVKASNSPYYVRIAEFTAKNFVEKKRADFLKAPPTAEPGAAGTIPRRKLEIQKGHPEKTGWLFFSHRCTLISAKKQLPAKP